MPPYSVPLIEQLRPGFASVITVLVIAAMPLVKAAAASAPRSTERSESSNISAFG